MLFFSLFILCYGVVIPICVLLHEIGHGVGVVSTSKYHAHVYLGNKNNKIKENFRFGRLHFHINWSYIGYAAWDGKLKKRQRAVALAGGPIMSLILLFIFGLIALSTLHNYLRFFFWGTTVFNFIQFIVTTLPITYPWWMGTYKGYPSDGLQLLRLLRK